MEREKPHLTDTVTNEVTHCIPKMHVWIMKAWMPLFRMYHVDPEPTWEAFRQEYTKELQGWWAECPDKIGKKGMETEIRGRPEDKAGGIDRWRTAEAQLLPSVSFNARPQVFETVAESGEWPSPLEYCTILMAPKSDRSGACEQRPITTFSVWTVG